MLFSFCCWKNRLRQMKQLINLYNKCKWGNWFVQRETLSYMCALYSISTVWFVVIFVVFADLSRFRYVVHICFFSLSLSHFLFFFSRFIYDRHKNKCNATSGSSEGSDHSFGNVFVHHFQCIYLNYRNCTKNASFYHSKLLFFLFIKFFFIGCYICLNSCWFV